MVVKFLGHLDFDPKFELHSTQLLVNRISYFVFIQNEHQTSGERKTPHRSIHRPPHLAIDFCGNPKSRTDSVHAKLDVFPRHARITI